MRDFTTNNYCDFLWINDLLQLKKNAKNSFAAEVREKQKLSIISVTNVIIFGTVIEVKQIGCKGYVYQIDDGTGVIACKHSQEQFEELIRAIESEQADSFNETLEHQQMEQSVLTDVSADDSVFNDRSIQIEEINLNKRAKLKGLQSIWDDLYASFNSLIMRYNIGDSVLIQGKLYNYFNVNQIYINTIRTMNISEEIMQITIKLDKSANSKNKRSQNISSENPTKRRLSSVVTFDNIQKPGPSFSVPARITPPLRDDAVEKVGIVTPNLDTTVTFDTFPGEL